jgi:hypothetical protein
MLPNGATFANLTRDRSPILISISVLLAHFHIFPRYPIPQVSNAPGIQSKNSGCCLLDFMRRKQKARRKAGHFVGAATSDVLFGALS